MVGRFAQQGAVGFPDGHSYQEQQGAEKRGSRRRKLQSLPRRAAGPSSWQHGRSKMAQVARSFPKSALRNALILRGHIPVESYFSTAMLPFITFSEMIHVFTVQFGQNY